MRPFYFIGIGLLLLSAVAWAIRPLRTDARTPLVWVSDDAPTRRLTIDLFDRLHPGLDLQLDPKDPNSGGAQKVIVQSLAGVGPDVFDCYTPNELAAYVKSGVAGDMTDDLKAAGIDLSKDAWPIVRQHCMLDGRVYGVPANASVDALWFNKSAFEHDGVPVPTAIAGWNELIDLAKRLTVRDAAGRVTRYGLSFDDTAWLVILRSFGGTVFSADGTRCTLDSPRSVAAVQLVHDLIFKHKVMAGPAEQDAAAQEGGWGSYGMRSLVGNTAAMSIGGRWWLLTLRKDPSLRLGVVRLPLMPGGVAAGGGKATLLNAKSPHRREAIAFFKFMAGPDYNRLINREADAVGGIARYATDDNLNDPRFPNEDFHGTFRAAMDAGVAPERSPFVDASAADRIINKQLDLARRDAKSVDDAMRDATAMVNAEIAKTLRTDPSLNHRYDALVGRGDSSRHAEAPAGVR